MVMRSCQRDLDNAAATARRVTPMEILSVEHEAAVYVEQAAADVERFWSKVQKGDGCWIWLAGKNRQGYGQFHVASGRARGLHVVAHRFAYEITHGPIPDGIFVCHSCDNPPCVNPDHLWLGTPGDNTRDAFAKGRQVPPTPFVPEHRAVCCRGHEMTEENTYIPPNQPNVRRCRACGPSRRREDRIVAEQAVVGEIAPRPDPDCTHERLSALRSAGSTFDDVATHWGFCPDCDDYFVVTEWTNGDVESRHMTEDEQLRFAAAEDRRSRNEWLNDFQEGL